MGFRTKSMIGYLQEKMKGVGGESMMMIKETTQAKLKEMGADEMIRNLQEKLKVMGEESMMMMRETAQTNFKEMGADEMTHNLQEKLNELLLILENFGSSLTAWWDKGFPPETIKERIQRWIHASAPYVLLVVAGLVLFWCCSRCLRYCCRVKMMKAPGRNFRMPRSVFEANPKGYFGGLHASKLKYR